MSYPPPHGNGVPAWSPAPPPSYAEWNDQAQNPQQPMYGSDSPNMNYPGQPYPAGPAYPPSSQHDYAQCPPNDQFQPHYGQAYPPGPAYQPGPMMVPPQEGDRGLGTFFAQAQGGGFMNKFTHMAGSFLGNSDGIKDLLKRASAEAVKILGVTDGYFTHQVAKILLPPNLGAIASVARRFKLDSYIERFILSMNRAAEQAATSALPIFHRFISGLSGNDLANMVTGEGSAATQFFRQQSERDLEQAYAPIVVQSMDSWNVTRHFNEIQNRAKHIPGLNNFHVDIHQYTVKKALDGLFYVLGDQENKLRADPTGHISNVMHQFFDRK